MISFKIFPSILKLKGSELTTSRREENDNVA